MKILDWENKVSQKLHFTKTENILELKEFLSNMQNYFFNFCAYEISEGQISNEDFYAAYIFNEREILKKDIIVYGERGWNTTIILLSSENKQDIDDFCVLGLNGFNDADIKNFYRDFLSI